MHLVPQEELQLLQEADYEHDDDDPNVDIPMNVDLIVPTKGKHNYHASRIVLPPLEALEFNKTVEKELDEEDIALEEEMCAYTQFINHSGYAIPFIFGIFFCSLLSLYITGFIDHSLKR